MEQSNPSKEQIYTAFKEVIGYECEYSDEIEAFMLKAIADYKNEYGIDHLDKVMNATRWQKLKHLMDI